MSSAIYSQSNGPGSNDRFMKTVLSDVRKEMTLRIERLQKEQTALTISLHKRFDGDEFRRLNIVNQHILVAYSRRRGEWVRGDYPDYATIAK